MKIREEQPEDIASIRQLNQLAFGEPEEATLVDALRLGGGVILSLVAEDGPDMLGHILFSPVVITQAETTYDAVGLAPMAVHPDHQRQGVGSQLVREGLRHLRNSGHEAVIVLGHPEYYPRFGFRRASEFGIRWNHPAPDEAFMALELRPGSLHGQSGVVTYRPEFDEV